ncbi:MAG: recombinase family protein [bacterium]
MKAISYFIYLRKSSESEDRQELSIPAQKREMLALVKRKGLKIVGEPLEEACSAMVPGRPLFKNMMDAIDRGKATGIVCWKLDRLARNPLDGGRIMQALGERRIQEIITPEFTYTATGADKMLMAIMFGMATKYSDDLSDNVRRGNREALERGLWPGRPKLGYVRDPRTNRLVADPERFTIVHEMWRLLLADKPVLDILHLANDRRGLRTPTFGSQGNKPLSRSMIYRLFGDPFYAGQMVRNGAVYQGSHPPMVSLAEFDRAQEILARRCLWREPDVPGKLFFTYRGLISCVSCGGMVTAKNTTNRHGSKYVHYYCWKKNHKHLYCPEGAVQEREIERQFLAFLDELVIPPAWAATVVSKLDRLRNKVEKASAKSAVLTEEHLRKLETRLQRLRTVFLDDNFTEEEYRVERNRLLDEKARLEENLSNPAGSADYLEPYRNAFLFVNKAKSVFEKVNSEQKRELVQRLTWNLKLKDKKLLIEAKNPFALCREWPRFPNGLAYRDVIRTFFGSIQLNLLGRL